MSDPVKIGDMFFMFDENRRVYERDENGRDKGGPTFRGHFYPVTIEGETSRSWVTNWGDKIPKSSPFPPLYTESMIDDAEWVRVHRYRISQVINRIDNAHILRTIAAIVGYDAERNG